MYHLTYTPEPAPSYTSGAGTLVGKGEHTIMVIGMLRTLSELQRILAALQVASPDTQQVRMIAGPLGICQLIHKAGSELSCDQQRTNRGSVRGALAFKQSIFYCSGAAINEQRDMPMPITNEPATVRGLLIGWGFADTESCAYERCVAHGHALLAVAVADDAIAGRVAALLNEAGADQISFGVA